MESYGKGCSLSKTQTFCFHLPTMKFYQPTNNCQSKSQATKFTSCCTIFLPKVIKNVRQKICMNTYTCVTYLDLGICIHAFQSNLYSPSIRGKFHCVRKQIPHHLLQAA